MLESQQKQAVVLSLTHSSSKPEEYNTWCFDAHIFCRRYRPRSDEYDLKKCTIVQFYLIHVGIRVLSPLHLWKHPLKTIVFKEREGGKNRTKEPNQTKKKSMQLIHSEHFCK